MGVAIILSIISLCSVTDPEHSDLACRIEHDASRRANFIDWIKGQQPDILAITELVGFTEKNLGQLASEYGHKYYAIVKEEGYPVGITSNEPITVVKKQVEDFWHGMLHVKTYGLDIIVTHLSPHDWNVYVSGGAA